MRRRRACSGTAALETVLVTGVTVPICMLLFFLAADACRGLNRLIAALVGWAYL